MESTILRIELNRIKAEKQILESKILDFYTKLDKEECPYLYTPDITLEYRNHFNIQIDRQGYIDHGNRS